LSSSDAVSYLLPVGGRKGNRTVGDETIAGVPFAEFELDDLADSVGLDPNRAVVSIAAGSIGNKAGLVITKAAVKDGSAAVVSLPLGKVGLYSGVGVATVGSGISVSRHALTAVVVPAWQKDTLEISPTNWSVLLGMVGS
jgi:hypothetical protein